MNIKKRVPALLLFWVMLITCIVPLNTPVVNAAGGPQIEGWTVAGNGGADYSWKIDNENANSGNSSLWVSNRSARANNVFGYIQATVAVEKGADYEYGFYAKANNISEVTYMIDWNARTEMKGPSFDWTPFTGKYTHNSDKATVYLNIIQDSVAIDLWIDDVYFYKVENGKRVGPNLISNGTFEAEVKEEDDVLGRDFSLDTVQEVMSTLPAIPVFRNDDVKIDGDVSEWGDIPNIHMPVNDGQYYHLNPDPADITADMKFAYDDKNMYIAISVTDDVHYIKNDADNFWRGDCIQFTMSNFDETYGQEMNVIYDPTTKEAVVYDESVRKYVTAAATQNGNVTTYEMAVSWSVRFDSRPDEFLFSILAHDCDGGARKNVLQLSPGIVTDKSNSKFPTFMTMEGKDFFSWMDTKSGIKQTDSLPVDLCIVNYGDEQEFTVTTGTGGTEKINVPARSGVKRTVVYPIENRAGNHDLKFNIMSEKNGTVEINRTVTTVLDDNEINGIIKRSKAYQSEIKSLLDKCSQKGLTTDYETMYYEIIKMFVSNIETDRNNDFYMKRIGPTHIAYVSECLEKLYNEAKDNLNAYLSGEKTPMTVPKYVTSDNPMEIDGLTQWLDMDVNGKIERRPGFLIGYGHFGGARNAMPFFPKIGSNTIQQELGPAQYFGWHMRDSASGNGDYGVPDYGKKALDSYCKMLEDAEKNNIAVDVLIATHYFITELYDKYPGLGGKAGNFIGFNIMHPKGRQLIEDFVRVFCDRIKDYRSINAICLANEIQFRSSVFPDFYNNDWTGCDGTQRDGWWSYLKKLYDNDISKLNKVYGTEYEKFEDIEMPVNTSDNPEKIADYKNFNDPILKEWHEWLKSLVREYMPDVPIQSKIMPMLNWGSYYALMGENVEAFADFSELNGCDASAYYKGTPLERKLYWYDYMVSAKAMPIVNSEDHIIPDGDEDFSFKHAIFNSADIWQGAIHGRGQSQIWLWEKNYDHTSYMGDGAAIRPDVVADIGKASMDLNRLSYEMNALETKKADVLLMYSDSSRIHDAGDVWTATEPLYKALMFNGKKVHFLLDSQSNMLNPEDYRLLVVPEIPNVTTETLNKVKEYIERGGKVLIIGNNAFAYDEHNRPHDAEIVKFIRDNSTIIDSEQKYDADKVIFDALTDAKLTNVTLVDAETGERIKNVEYNTAVYDGKLLVNVCNYEWNNKKVKIMLNQTPVTGLTELRSGEALSDEFEIEGYKPLLIQSTLSNPFFDMIGHWAEDTVSLLREKGIVKGVTESAFDPEKRLTKAEFLTLAERAAEINESDYKGGLKDVSSTDWFSKAVQSALDNGTIDDIIENGEFNPNDGIDREDMAYLAVKIYEWKTKTEAAGESYTFTDGNEISDDRKSYISKAYALGIIKGNENGEFLPKSTLTRAEGATVVYRLLNILN